MKNTNLISVVAVAFAMSGCVGIGGSVGPFQGKITNYTEIPTEQFTISVGITCRDIPTIGPAPRCGSQGAVVHPDKDGNYTVPALDVRTIQGADYEFDASITAPNGTRYAKSSLSLSVWGEDQENADLVNELKNITIFPFDAQKVNFLLSSGDSIAEWMAGQGRDVFVGYTFDFSLGKGNDHQVAYVTAGGPLSTATAESFQPALLIVTGQLAANAPVLVQAKVFDSELSMNDLADRKVQIPYSSTLPADLRTFSVDDRNLPTISRELTGQWNVGLNFDTYQAGSENNFFDGKLKVRCQDGVVSGSIDLTPRLANIEKWSGTAAVTGTCNGESGELRFTMPYASNEPESELVMQFDRIGLWNSNQSLLALGNDPLYGAIFTGGLKIKASGAVVGSGSVTK